VPAGERKCVARRSEVGFHLHIKLKWNLQSIRHGELAQPFVVQVLDETCLSRLTGPVSMTILPGAAAL